MKKLIILALVCLISTPCFAGMGMRDARNSSRGTGSNFNERMNDYRDSVRERRANNHERMNDYRQNQRERWKERREQRGSGRRRGR